MKTHLLFASLLCLFLCNGCFSENYLDQLNTGPELKAFCNLSVIDTLKIGTVQNAGKNIYYSFPISLSDNNSNLKSLQLDIDDSFTITDNIGQPMKKFYDLDSRERSKGLSEVFRLYPSRSGKYRAKFTAIDKFNVCKSLYKDLYIFDNLPPKCEVADAHYVVFQLLHLIYIDLSVSFDQDKRWGGAIAAYHALYHYTWDNEAFPMGSGGINTPHPWLLEIADFANEPIGWIEAWVTDNEGTESEHIKINPIKR